MGVQMHVLCTSILCAQRAFIEDIVEEHVVSSSHIPLHHHESLLQSETNQLYSKFANWKEGLRLSCEFVSHIWSSVVTNWSYPEVAVAQECGSVQL